MNCVNCRKQIPDDSCFCPFCGTSQIRDSAPVDKDRIFGGSGSEPRDTDQNSVMPSLEDLTEKDNLQDDKANEAAAKTIMHYREDTNELGFDSASKSIGNSGNVTSKILADDGKKRYCSRCGSIIDTKTGKCTGCGKRYRRFKAFDYRTAFIVTLILAFVLMGALCYFVYIDYNKTNLIANMDALIAGKNKIIDEKDASIKTLQNDYDELKDRADGYYKMAFSAIDELAFWEEHAVIVSDDGKRYYHRYQCTAWDGYDFWIYNIEAAEQKGYKPCPECH